MEGEGNECGGEGDGRERDKGRKREKERKRETRRIVADGAGGIREEEEDEEQEEKREEEKQEEEKVEEESTQATDIPFLLIEIQFERSKPAQAILRKSNYLGIIGSARYRRQRVAYIHARVLHIKHDL